MFRITRNLATHGLDFESGESVPKEWVKIDVRELVEEDNVNTPELYLKLYYRIYHELFYGKNVVICCSGGVSRSNAMALIVLIQMYNMNFYDALALVEDKVPICQIEDTHINAIKSMFNVGPP